MRRRRSEAAPGGWCSRFDPVYDARPLRRYLQRELETRIGRALVAGNGHDGATIKIEVKDAALVVFIVNPRAKPGVETSA